jgi:hypothetical protein
MLITGLAERIGWTKQPVMDEMELLAVIEKQAETYSSGPGSEDLLTSPSVLPGTCQTQPGEAWPTHHHHHQQQQQPHPEMLAAPYASAPHQPSRPIQPLPSRQQPALPSTQPTAVQDKPYKCTLCPKSFTRNYDLYVMFEHRVILDPWILFLFSLFSLMIDNLALSTAQHGI